MALQRLTMRRCKRKMHQQLLQLMWKVVGYKGQIRVAFRAVSSIRVRLEDSVLHRISQFEGVLQQYLYFESIMLQGIGSDSTRLPYKTLKSHKS